MRKYFVSLLAPLFIAATSMGATLADGGTTWDATGGSDASGVGTGCGSPGSPCPYDSIPLSKSAPVVTYIVSVGAAAEEENFELRHECGAVRIRAVVGTGSQLDVRHCQNSATNASTCDTAAGMTGAILVSITASGEYGPYMTWPEFVTLDRTAVSGVGPSYYTFSCYEKPVAQLQDLGGQPLDADLTALAGLAGVQGDVIYRNAAQWTRLPAGISGQVLHTLGAGANPAWDTDDVGGGGGGNAVEVTLDFGSGAADASAVVTGQAWVASSSKIVCAPTLLASGTRVEGEEDAVLEGLILAVHSRVAATGFTLTGSVREGIALGQFTVHCLGV